MRTQIIDCKFKAWKGLEGVCLKKKYIVTSYIDSGSYGDIFECFNIDYPNEKLAVKFSENIAVLAQELRIVKKLQEYRHKGIVKLIDFTAVVLENFSETQSSEDLSVWGCYIMPYYTPFKSSKNLMKIGGSLLDSL